MAEHRVSHSWTPNFGFKLVAAALEATPTPQAAPSVGDLSSIRSLMNAGEQVTAEVRTCLERLQPCVIEAATLGDRDCNLV